MSNLIQHITIEPQSSAVGVVIFLHGLGGEGKHFQPLINQLQLDVSLRFVLPTADSRSITINNGMMMPAWYDILQISNSKRHLGVEDFNHSIEQLNLLIDVQKKDFGSDKIVVAGFSQGGAMALHLGLTLKQKLAGIIALSTYLPTEDELLYTKSAASLETPFYCMHGSLDDVVPLSLGKQAHDFLSLHGFQANWGEYVVGHSLCNQQLQDMSKWLNNIFVC